MRTFRLYLRLLDASIRAQMQYRVSFLIETLRLVLTYLSVLTMVWIMLQRFGFLKSWTFGETAFLFGLAVFSWGLTMPLFFPFLSVERYVLLGTFDRFLTRPLSPFVQVMADRFNLGAAGQIIFTAIAFVVASRHIDVAWTPFRVGFLIVSVVTGALIQGAAVLTVSALCFWTLGARRFYWVFVRPAREMTWFPVSIYPRPLQLALTFVLPFAFINFFPAQVLLGKHDPVFPAALAYAGPLVGVAVFLAAYRFWHVGLNRYESTGS